MRLRVCDAAVLVLRETGNPAVMWGDSGLLHAIANRASLHSRNRAWHTEIAVLNALSAQPGKLLVGETKTMRGRRVRIFRLPLSVEGPPT